MGPAGAGRALRAPGNGPVWARVFPATGLTRPSHVPVARQGVLGRGARSLGHLSDLCEVRK
jgi:hypothetical protein